MASSEASSENLAIIYLDVYISEEPKGNVHCGTYVCTLGDKFDVYARIENTSNETRTYAVVIEVRNASDDTTVLLTTESGETPPDQSKPFYIPWTPDQGGDYEVRAFLITDLDSPQVLSPVKTSEVSIVDYSFKGLIRMEKSFWVGSSPAGYRVDVYENRTAIFEGSSNVAKPGKHIFEISEEQLNELIEEFEKADFLSMNYSGPPPHTDASDVAITFNMDGNTNSIYHQNTPSVPEKLLELEKRIDEILGTKKWVEGE